MKLKTWQVYLLWLVLAVIIVVSGVSDRTQEAFRAAKIDRRISNENIYEGVYLEYAYLSGDEIVVLFTAKDAFGTDYYFTVDEIVVNGDCSIDSSDFDLFGNTSNEYTSPAGYLNGSYGTKGQELTVNFTEIVSFSYWDNVISIDVIQDTDRDLTNGNPETLRAIDFLCAKG